MDKKIIVAPSILSADFSILGEEIKNIESSGADYIHCDIMDGVFVPNISFGIPVVKSVKNVATRPLDVHLMIVNPHKYISAFVEAGADIITFHAEVYENEKQRKDALMLAKEKGIKCGLTINPDISEELVIPHLEYIDMVLVMTVFAGFGGQKFLSEPLKKIEKLRNIIEKNNLNVDIEVDGGINDITAKYCYNAGANVFVAGNYVFTANNYKSAIDSIKQHEK